MAGVDLLPQGASRIRSVRVPVVGEGLATGTGPLLGILSCIAVLPLHVNPITQASFLSSLCFPAQGLNVTTGLYTTLGCWRCYGCRGVDRVLFFGGLSIRGFKEEVIIVFFLSLSRRVAFVVGLIGLEAGEKLSSPCKHRAQGQHLTSSSRFRAAYLVPLAH